MKTMTVTIMCSVTIIFLGVFCSSPNITYHEKNINKYYEDTVTYNAQYGIEDCKLSNYLHDSIRPLIINCIDSIDEIGYSGFFYVTISETGEVISVKTLRSSHEGVCEENIIIRIYNMREWIPGKQNGRLVTTHRIIEVKYKKAG